MKYLIEEKRLIELLVAELKLQCLENDGVDNWSYYYEGKDNFLLDCINGRAPKEKIPEDLDFEDITELDIKNFEKGDK